MRVVVCGKGGVGKSTVTALLAGALRSEQPLIVDADPVGRLGRLLGVTPGGTVAEALERVAAQQGVDRVLAGTEAVEALLTPVPDVGTLLVMGQYHHEGCFCTVHRLLRTALDFVAGRFSLVLLDAEGGVEHVNRATAGRAEGLVVVAEPTVNALDVALAVAAEAGARLAPDRACLVLNHTRPAGAEVGGDCRAWLERWPHARFSLPHSPAVAARQAAGRHLLAVDDAALEAAVGGLADWVAQGLRGGSATLGAAGIPARQARGLAGRRGGRRG